MFHFFLYAQMDEYGYHRSNPFLKNSSGSYIGSLQIVHSLKIQKKYPLRVPYFKGFCQTWTKGQGFCQTAPIFGNLFVICGIFFV